MVRSLSVPFLPLGLAPCSSGKITESICLLTRSPAASSCRTGIFYSELGFLSTGLFPHTASLVWPPEIFLLHRKNLLYKISLFSECVLRTCWRATSIFLPILQNTIDDSGENDQACHVSCAVGSLPAFGVSGLPGHLVFTVLSSGQLCKTQCSPFYYSPYSMPERLPEHKRVP